MAAELDEKARTDARVKQQTTWKFIPSAPRNWLDYDFGTTTYDYETPSD
ncbi:hypothetical protein [Bartonella sp. 1-1C]|nr:hypothetical protein [Bartonella sp. 1-1C]CBI80820.1 hypothetical protein B11C_110431 [Bartonella sp. 1-1C]